MSRPDGRRRADGSRAMGYREGYVPKQLATDCYAVLAANPDLRPMGVRGVGYILMGWPRYAAQIAAQSPDGKYLHMQRVKDALIDARRGRYVPFDWVWDQKAVASRPLEWDGLDAWAADVRDLAGNLRLRRQAGQQRYIEVWTEAAATVAVIERVAHEYGVPVYSDGGQHHLTGIYDLAQRAAERDVPTLVLHLGDYDAAGRRIYERFAADVQSFNPDVEFQRIGLVPEQIERLGLAGLADPNGDLQLEAMIADIGPETEAAIRRYIDLDALAATEVAEDEARRQALRFLDGEDEA